MVICVGALSTSQKQVLKRFWQSLRRALQTASFKCSRTIHPCAVYVQVFAEMFTTQNSRLLNMISCLNKKYVHQVEV